MVEENHRAEESQTEINHFVLRELEKLQLLVARLKERGVVSQTDWDFAELRSAAREQERFARVAERDGDSASARQYRASVSEINRRIERLDKG